MFGSLHSLMWTFSPSTFVASVVTAFCVDSYMPLYVSHVLRILRIVSDVVNDVVLRDGRIFLPCPAHSLDDSLVVLRSVDFVSLTRDSA